MNTNTEDLEINILIKKLNATAEKGKGITLTPQEVKILADEMGDLVFIPFWDGKIE